MATESTIVILISVYLLIMFLFLFFWYQFHEMRKSFWQNRNIDIKDPIKPVDLTPRFSSGIRRKPISVSDSKLFEIEQNPAKR